MVFSYITAIRLSLFTCSYLNRLYVRFIRPITPSALVLPIDLTVNPFIDCSMNPNICSTHALVLDFNVLVFFSCVTLPRCYCKTGIYHLAFIHYQAFDKREVRCVLKHHLATEVDDEMRFFYLLVPRDTHCSKKINI